MKLKNINADIVKAHGNDSRLMVGYYDTEHIGITYDGVAMYILKTDDFLFDTVKLLRGREATSQIPRVINDALDGALDAVLTGVMIAQNKKTLYELKTEKFSVYIDGKFLRNFDKVCTFKCTSPKSPVVVYEEKNLAGVILPVIYQK